jgi:hypothetical protein
MRSGTGGPTGCELSRIGGDQQSRRSTTSGPVKTSPLTNPGSTLGATGHSRPHPLASPGPPHLRDRRNLFRLPTPIFSCTFTTVKRQNAEKNDNCNVKPGPAGTSGTAALLRRAPARGIPDGHRTSAEGSCRQPIARFSSKQGRNRTSILRIWSCGEAGKSAEK